jgi:hypothetical protein
MAQGGNFPFFAIYALDGDNLTICVNRHGDTNPTEFTAQAGTQMTLLDLKRVVAPGGQHALKKLKAVRLSFTGVTADGVAELQKALPETTIIVK